VRAFVAVPITGEEAVTRLRALLSQLRGIRGLKAVPPQQLHFTLKFFDELPGARVASAKSAAARTAGSSPAVSLSLSGLGVFPPRGPARVLWVGCGAGAEGLMALASAAEAEFSREGFERETRPFSPHLTLARVKDPRASRAAAELAASGAAFDGGTLELSEVVLFQSVLGPAGAAHTPLGRWPLGGSRTPSPGR